MNYDILIKALTSIIFNVNHKSYDPITDFQRLIDSPNLFACVIDQFKEEPLKNIEKRHQNPDLMRIEVNKFQIKIFKNDETVFDENYNNNGNNLRNFVLNKIRDLGINQNAVFSTKIDKDVNKEILREFNSAMDCAIEFLENDLFILEIEKDEMFNLKKNNYVTFLQYFYTHKNKFYCAYIRDYDPSSFSKKTKDPEINYLIRTMPDVEVDERNLLTYREFTKGYCTSFSYMKYQNYIFFEVIKNVRHTKDFLRINFCREESNNYFSCLDVLMKNNALDNIMEQYIKTLTEEQFLKLAAVFCRLCICKKNTYSDRCHFEHNRSNECENFEMNPCKTFNSLSCFDKKLNLKNTSVEELEKFFKYVLEEHEEKILKYENDFLDIIADEIRQTMIYKFLNLKGKVFDIIMYYNVMHVQITNQNWIHLSKLFEEHFDNDVRELIKKY